MDKNPKSDEIIKFYSIFLNVLDFYSDFVENYFFVALILLTQCTIAIPVSATGPAKQKKKGRPVSSTSRTGTFFLSRLHDVIASFSFGACAIRACFREALRS